MRSSAHGLAVLVHLGVDVAEAPQPHDATAVGVRGLLLQLGQLIWGAVCNAVCRTTNGAASSCQCLVNFLRIVQAVNGRPALPELESSFADFGTGQ